MLGLRVPPHATRHASIVADDDRALVVGDAHEGLRVLQLGQAATPPQSEALAREALAALELPDADVAVVVSDLGEAVGAGGAPVLCEQLRARHSLTLAVGVMPLPFSGALRLAHATGGLTALRAASDACVVVDTATLSGTMSGANYLAAQSLFSDMVAFNVHALLLPLLRADDLKRITMAQYRAVFRRNALDTRGRLARLVCAQATREDGAAGERGSTVLQRALTDAVFPVNDLGKCSAVLVSIDSSKDLSFAGPGGGEKDAHLESSPALQSWSKSCASLSTCPPLPWLWTAWHFRMRWWTAGSSYLWRLWKAMKLACLRMNSAWMLTCAALRTPRLLPRWLHRRGRSARWP